MYEAATYDYDGVDNLSYAFKYDPFGRRIYKSSGASASVSTPTTAMSPVRRNQRKRAGRISVY